MNKSIAVIGLGRYGKSIATELYKNGADVLVIDGNPEIVNEIALNAIPLLFAYYVLQIVHINAKQMLHAKWMLALCGVVDVAALVTNPYTHWVYEAEGWQYTYDYGVLALITVAIAAIVASSVVALHRVNHTLFAKAMVVLFHMLLVVLAVFLQLKTHVLLLNFVTATVCLTIYYYLQNPNAVIDTVTKQFNRRFFGEYLHTFFINEKPFGIVVVAMDDFKSMMRSIVMRFRRRLIPWRLS